MSLENNILNKKTYYSNIYNKNNNKLVEDKDLIISQMKAQIYELEQSEKNYAMIAQKFRNLQNDVYVLNEEKLNLESELQRNNDIHNAKITDLNNQIKHMNEDLLEKLSINKKLMNDNSQLYKSLELKNSEITQLKFKLDNISSDYDNIHNEKNIIDEKNTNIIENLNSLRQEYEVLQNENRYLSKSLTEKESNIRVNESERIKLLSKIEENNFEKENLQTKIKLNEETIKSLQKNYNDLMKESLEHQANISENEVLLDKLKGEIKLLNNSLNNEKSIKIQNENTMQTMDTIIEDKIKEVEIFNSEIKNLRDLIDKNNKSFNLKKAECERLKSHIIVITEQNENISNNMKDFSELYDVLISKFYSSRREKLLKVLEDSRNKINNSLTTLENYSLKEKNENKKVDNIQRIYNENNLKNTISYSPNYNRINKLLKTKNKDKDKNMSI